MQAFFTLAKSNLGAKCILKDPAGKVTEHWLTVLGVDSDAFRVASLASRRALAAWFEEHGDSPEVRKSVAFAEFTDLQQRTMRASLVTAWSFDQELTMANVVELFKQAPDLAAQADAFASKREQFAGA